MLAINSQIHPCQMLANVVLIRVTFTIQFNANLDYRLRLIAMDADLTVLVSKTHLLPVLNATEVTS